MKVREQLIAELKALDMRKSAEIQELKRKLQDGGKGINSISEALKERDLALMQVAIEKQIAQHANAQLEEELVAKRQLQEKCTQLKESLCLAESKVEYLKSNDYQSAIIEKSRPTIIEEFRQSAMGKIEVALACKVGCDHMVAQLPAEYQELRGRLQYPPSIANYIGLLANVENAGGGYNVRGGDDEEEPEEVSDQSTDDSTGGVEKNISEDSTGKKSDDAGHDISSTPPPSTNVSLPMTPRADWDL